MGAGALPLCEACKVAEVLLCKDIVLLPQIELEHHQPRVNVGQWDEHSLLQAAEHRLSLVCCQVGWTEVAIRMPTPTPHHDKTLTTTAFLMPTPRMPRMPTTLHLQVEKNASVLKNWCLFGFVLPRAFEFRCETLHTLSYMLAKATCKISRFKS